MSGDAAPATGPLVEIGLHDVALLYAALNRAGRGPREADELEIWECAVLLGALEEEKDDEPQRASATDRFAHLRARVAHSQGAGPKPEAAPVPMQTLQMMGNAFA